MKKFLLVLLVPLVLSATAVAASNPASATAHCKKMLRTSPGLFAPVQGATYADLAACIAAKTAEAAKNTTNAAKTCKAAKAANPTEFAKTYSSSPNAKSNAKSAKSDGKAMGACVSLTAKASTAAQQKNELNAAKQCKLWRSDATVFAAAHASAPAGTTFASMYGKNKNGKNAFGKCVSMQSKAKHS